jgi:hypothetical protein
MVTTQPPPEVKDATVVPSDEQLLALHDHIELLPSHVCSLINERAREATLAERRTWSRKQPEPGEGHCVGDGHRQRPPPARLDARRAPHSQRPTRPWRYRGRGQVCIEAKNEKRIALSVYVDETLVDQANANAAGGVTWIRRRGKASPGSAYVVITGAQFVELLNAAGY